MVAWSILSDTQVVQKRGSTFSRRSVVGATIRIATAGSRQSFEALVRLMEAQRLRPVIDRTFAVSDFRSALDYFGRGSHFGKVALTF